MEGSKDQNWLGQQMGAPASLCGSGAPVPQHLGAASAAYAQQQWDKQD